MRFALVVALLAVLIRLAPGSGGERPLFSDERDYDRLARTLAATGRYDDDGHPTAYRSVGYPAFVAAVYRIAGPDREAVRVVQAILDGATAFLLFLLVRGGGVGVARGAALLWAIFPPAILYSRFLRPETLTAFLLVAIAVVLAREASLPRLARFGAGLLLGIAALVRSEFVVVLPLVPFVIERGVGRPRRAALLLAGACLVIVPWVARNSLVVGAPTISTSIGGAFLIGNHPGATGGYAPSVPDSLRPSATDEAEASEEAARSAARYIAEHPGRFVAGIPRKCAFMLMGETELVVSYFHDDPADRRTSFREKARAIPVWIHAAVSLPFALLLLLGTIGYLSPPGGAAPRFFLAIAGAWLIVHGVTFGGSRFHFPWMPFLAASSVMLLGDVRSRLAAMNLRSSLFAVSIWAFALAVWIVEIKIVWYR